MRRPAFVRPALIAAVLLALAACGGGGSRSPPTQPPTNPPTNPPPGSSNWDSLTWDTDNWA
jgi:hypothetical protein